MGGSFHFRRMGMSLPNFLLDRRSRKLLLFILFYVAVTFVFLVTSFPENIQATPKITIRLPRKDSKGNKQVNANNEDNKNKRFSTLYWKSNSVAIGQQESMEAKPNVILPDEYGKTISVEPMCDMDKYLKVSHEICDRFTTKGLNSNRSNANIHDVASYSKQWITNLQHEKEILLRGFSRSCTVQSVYQNCNDIRYSYLYGKENISNEERAYPLAFALKIHRDANQAHRLLRYIYRRHNVYCIHVDKKAPSKLYDIFKAIGECLDNVIVIADRVHVIYSSIRQVQAELTCMTAALKSPVNWKYYINLTGQEFMLKTNLELVRILKLLNGSNDIESYPIGLHKDRITKKTVFLRHMAFRTASQKQGFHRNITFKKGSAYGLFSREFVKFVTMDKFVTEFIDWLNDTYAPEETLWATLNALPNVPGGFHGDITDADGSFISRAVKWKGQNSEKCYGKIVRFVCVFGVGDMPWLLKHKNVIANKFYERFQPDALNCLESIMYRTLMSHDGVRANFDVNIYKTRSH